MTFLALAFLALVPPEAPSPRDTQELAVCLTAVEDPRVCIGTVSDRCMEFETGGRTTAGMIACSRRELAMWDQRLNTAYAQLRTRVLNTDQEPRRDLLRAAQRAWIEYRALECDQQAMQFLGGSLSGVIHVACLTDMTGQRALELESQLEALEL